MSVKTSALLLRNAQDTGRTGPRDLLILDGRVRSEAGPGPANAIDLEGRSVLPALVNAHDVLDLASLPPLGAPPHASLYEWTRRVEDDLGRRGEGLSLPLVDRLFLGAMRNVLAGVGAVLHHHPDHRSLARPDFPVRVQRRYSFAHSPGLTRDLRRTYRTTDRRIPWVVRAAEGRDPALRSEIDALDARRLLRQNTVLVHGTALAPEDFPRLARAGTSVVWCPESDLRLYGRTLDVAGLLAAGVRVGLGTDGAPAGARDMLSTLAAARRSAGLDDAKVLALATEGAAAVARLPLGGLEEGAPADLLVVESEERLLAGDRRAVALLVVRGEPVYGRPELLAAAGRRAVPVRVEGEARAISDRPGRRLASLLGRHPALRDALWVEGIRLEV